MWHFCKQTFRARVILTGVVLPVVIAGPMIFAFHFHNQRTMIESCIAKAKAICLTADIAGSRHGCQFMVVANDSNLDLHFVGRESLNRRKLTDDGLADFHVIDRFERLVFYTYFVRARKSCLDCHGDPDKSKKLWANLNGSTGAVDELVGRAEGDVCGAYEVITPLSGGGKEIAWASVIAGTILLSGFGIYGIVLFTVMPHAVNQSGSSDNENEKMMTCSDSEIYDLRHPSNAEFALINDKEKNATVDN